MSNVQIQRGGNPVPVAPVFSDEAQIAALQAQVAALQAGVKSMPFPAAGIGFPKPGGAVVIVGASFALCSNASGANYPNPTGLDDGKGNIQSSGPLKLTTAQWDAVTGQVGGLTPDVTYFVDQATSGHIIAASGVSNGAGTYATIVGTAIDAETMDITLFPANGPHS